MSCNKRRMQVVPGWRAGLGSWTDLVLEAGCEGTLSWALLGIQGESKEGNWRVGLVQLWAAQSQTAGGMARSTVVWGISQVSQSDRVVLVGVSGGGEKWEWKRKVHTEASPSCRPSRCRERGRGDCKRQRQS